MGVMFQAFYWNCPRRRIRTAPGGTLLRQSSRVAPGGLHRSVAAAGMQGRQSRRPSMGYDPYDYFDLGDFNQKGRTKTWFGNQAELTADQRGAHCQHAGLCRPGARPQQRRRCAGGQSHRRPDALDQVQSRQRQVSARLEVLPSFAVRDLRRDDLRRHARPVPSQPAGVPGK